jgi:hypothetical protein
MSIFVKCLWAFLLSVDLLCLAKIQIKNARLIKMDSSRNVRLPFKDLQGRCKNNPTGNLVFILDGQQDNRFELVTSFTLLKHIQVIPFTEYAMNDGKIIFEGVDGLEKGQLPEGLEIQVWPGQGYKIQYSSTVSGDYLHKVTFIRGGPTLKGKMAVVFDCAYKLVLEESDDESSMAEISEQAVKVLGREYFRPDPFLQYVPDGDALESVTRDNFISAGFYEKDKGHLVDPQLSLFKGIYYLVELVSSSDDANLQLFPPILAKSNGDKLRFPPPQAEEQYAFRVMMEGSDDRFLILQDPHMKYQVKKGVWWSLTVAHCLRRHADRTAWSSVAFLLGILSGPRAVSSALLFVLVLAQNARGILFIDALIISVFALSFASLCKPVPAFNIVRVGRPLLFVLAGMALVLVWFGLTGILPFLAAASLSLATCLRMSGPAAVLAVLASAIKVAPKIPDIEAFFKWGIKVKLAFEPDILVLLALSLLLWSGVPSRKNMALLPKMTPFLVVLALPRLHLYHLWPAFLLFMLLHNLL